MSEALPPNVNMRSEAGTIAASFWRIATCAVVFRLRKVLRLREGDSLYIVTVPGQGYQYPALRRRILKLGSSYGDTKIVTAL